MKRKIFLSILLIGLTLSIIFFSNTFVFANEADGTNNLTVGNDYDPYTIDIYGMDHLKRELQYLRNNREDSDTNIYTIVLKSDNNQDYSTDERLSIPSYICLDLNGNTITYTGSTVEALRVGPRGDANDLSIPDAANVEIKNGTISGGGLYCVRAQNVKLNDIKLNNCTSYGITVKNSKNLEFNNLELNNISSGSGLSFEDCSIKVLNKIKCNNINKVGISLKTSTAGDITNCNIQNTGSHAIKLYISHVKNIKDNTLSNIGELGIYLKGPVQLQKNTKTGKLEPTETEDAVSGDIPIENNDYGSSAENIEHNTLKNCKSDGIGIYHGSWCKEIIYNELDTIGGNHNGYAGDYGIIIDSMMKAKTYCTRIANNTIKNVTYCGIAVYSGPSSLSSEWFDKKYQDTAYVEKNIENNKFINCGTYKPSDGWKNEFKQGCLSAIYIDTHALIKGDICNNTIETTGENGIYIHVFSSVSNIYNNTIKDCKEYGIHVYQNSTVRGNIESNKIYNCGLSSIAVTKTGTVGGLIKSNTIDKSNDIGIYASDSSIRGIANNQITNIKNIGICFYNKAKGQKSSTVNANIESNKIDTCGKSGIAITKNSSLEGSIKSNQIQNTSENGIYISENSLVADITSNKIKNIKNIGIYLNNKVTASGAIGKNNIYNCQNNGISVNNNSKLSGKMTSNTIEKITNNGVYVGNSSNVSSINNNILKNIKSVGIYLTNKAVALDINSNKISVNHVKNGFGIKAANNSKLRNIKKNTIDGKMIYAIRILGIYKNGEISSNIISTSNPNTKTFTGIYVDGNKSYKTSILKNTVTGNKTSYGIRLAQGKSDILNNTIKKSSYPIYVEKNNSAVKVDGNTVSGNSKNLIRTPNEKVNTNNIKLTSLKIKNGQTIKINYKSSNNIAKFQIYQSNKEKGTYKKIKTINATTYTTPKLNTNKEYFYKVRGYVKDGNITVFTKYSPIKSIKL